MKIKTRFPSVRPLLHTTYEVKCSDCGKVLVKIEGLSMSVTTDASEKIICEDCYNQSIGDAMIEEINRGSD